MAKIRIVGDSSGYVELAAPNAAGNNTLELPSNATKLVGADESNSLNVTGIVTATRFSAGSGTSISSPATNVLTLGTNNTEAVRIDSSGNVGVGKTNPEQKLDVIGLTRITQNTNGQMGLVVSMPTGVENTASGIRVHGYSPAIELLDKDAVQNWYIAIDDNVTNNFQIARGYGPGQGIDGVIEITPSDNVGIGITNPSQKLVVNGYIQTPNSSSGSVGLDIGYKKSVSITGSYSANTWYDTGVSSLTDTGIYILDVWTDTYNAGGETYQTSYVGLFVLANRNTNATNTSTITVHYSGHAPNTELFQFRTIQTLSNAGGTKLQWLSNKSLSGLDGSSGKRVEVSIHRFGSAINNA